MDRGEGRDLFKSTGSSIAVHCGTPGYQKPMKDVLDNLADQTSKKDKSLFLYPYNG